MKKQYNLFRIAIYGFLGLALMSLKLNAIHAQNSERLLSQNSCLVHLDKPFYVNGETLWYKIYLPKALQQFGAVFQIHLCNKEGKTLKSHYLKVGEGGFANGYISIPFDWSSDVYHLVVSSQTGKGLRFLQLTDIPIPIYNDENIPSAEEIVEDTPPMNDTDEASILDVQIKTNKSSYHTRELVQVELKLIDDAGMPLSGHGSVAVKDGSLIPSNNIHFPHIFEGAQIKQAFLLDDHIYLKANLVDSLEQLIFSGTLVAYSANMGKVLRPLTDGFGNFSLELPDVYGPQQLQWIDAKNPDGNVLSQNMIRVSNSVALSYPPQIIQYLNYSRERKKMYQLLGSIESGILLNIPPAALDSVVPDRKYYMDDYEPFADLPTFFQEIVTPLKARRTRKGIVYKMLNTEARYKSFYAEQPVFIVNQYVITDKEVINKLNYQDVEYIEMFNVYQKLVNNFGGLGLNGIVKIQTDQDLTFLAEKIKNTQEVYGFQTAADFPQLKEVPIYAPIVRPQIYWQPDININSNGVGQFSFLHTDDLGEFEIEIVVQDEDGRILTKTIRYIVDR